MRKLIPVSVAFLSWLSVAGQMSADTIFTHVEVMPVFPGCEVHPVGSPERKQCADREMVQFISRNLVYPQHAKDNGTEGTVYVSFIVDEKGTVVHPALLIDIGDDCGEAALDVIAAMPRWVPGSHQGHNVKVRLNIPIHFSLRDAEEDLAGRYTLIWGNLRGTSTSVEELAGNLGKTLSVRGPEGDPRYIDQLAFTYERNRKLINAVSRGDITEELQALVRKVKKGGTFTITVSVQDKGRFAYVSRSFRVIQ